jgi:hypothetical protein
VDENLAKQAQVMEVIDREAAAYKQAFGYPEWRAACEVGCLDLSLGCHLICLGFLSLSASSSLAYDSRLLYLKQRKQKVA